MLVGLGLQNNQTSKNLSNVSKIRIEGKKKKKLQVIYFLEICNN
jgi:hypothetical protein